MYVARVGAIALRLRYFSSWIARRATPSKRRGDRMTEMALVVCAQVGHSIPLACGRPQRGHSGGKIHGSWLSQWAHK